MTKLTVETDNNWTKKKIRAAIHTEIELLRKAVQRTQAKLQDFENKHGKFDRNSFYGKVDDLILIEWEGELETLKRLQEKLKSLEDGNITESKQLELSDIINEIENLFISEDND